MGSLIKRNVTVRDTPTPIALLLISFCVPTELSFNIGSLNLTMTKIVLLSISVILLIRSTPIKKHAHDYAIIGFMLWLLLSILIHHGLIKAVVSGGLSLLEILVSYFAARYYIKKPSHIYGLINLLAVVAMLLLPFLVYENITGVHIIHDLASSLTGMYYPVKNETRIGLIRASGPFNHPILLGVFFSAMIGMLWHSSKYFIKLKLLKTIALVSVTITALSSAPILVIIVQFFIIFWNKYAAFIRYRWRMIFIAMTCMYVFLLFYSDRSPLMAILSRITLDSTTSHYRTLIWDYGIQNVMSNPIFGIGFNDWVRVDWMVADTIDNFWLLQTMRYGMPAIIFLSWSIFSLMIKINKLKDMKQLSELKSLSMGWLVTIISLILVGFTVDFFGSNMPFFFFLLGLGAAIFKMQILTIKKYKNDQKNMLSK